MARRSIEMARGTDETPGEHIEEHVSDTGYFAIKRGESIQDHLHMVKECKEDYKRLVMRIEECGMGKVTSDGARFYGGKPIIVSYQRIDGLGRFIDTLFNAKRPFRL